MKRFSLLLIALPFLLAACADEGESHCDETQFDCTPIDDGNDDSNTQPPNKDPNAPPPWPPGWTPSMDELRDAGVVFPEDLDLAPETTQIPRIVTQPELGDDKYRFIYLFDDFDVFEHCDRQSLQAYERLFCTLLNTFTRDAYGQMVITGMTKHWTKSARTHICSFLANGGDQPNTAQVFYVDWSNGPNAYVTLYGPPTNSFDWRCIDTPYGAGWIDMPDADANVSVGLREDGIDLELDSSHEGNQTCHPDVPWIAFKSASNPSKTALERAGKERVPNSGVYYRDYKHHTVHGYTPGTWADEVWPIKDCRTWGDVIQSAK